MFKNEETLKAFNSWLKVWGINPYPNDVKDFNHFANKAINQYINKRYNIYDIN
jgi:hypothetical protein